MANPSDDEVAQNELIKERIQQHYDKFDGKFDPKGYVLDKLFAAGILTLADKMTISEPLTADDRSERLLNFLFKTCHPKAYIVFRETLLKEYKWMVEEFIDPVPNPIPLPPSTPPFFLDTELKKSGADITKTIIWSEWGMKREANYKVCEYSAPNGQTIQVFVADEVGPPPASFNTSGYRSMLHMGIDKESTNTGHPSVFFVIHPNGWKPFQQRFHGAPQLGLLDLFIGDHLQYIG